jgi:hypothetical protein
LAIVRRAGTASSLASSADQHLLAELRAGRGQIIDSELQNALGYSRQQATRRSFDANAWNPDDMGPKSGWASTC